MTFVSLFVRAWCFCTNVLPVQKTRLHFATTGLDRTAINTIYSHVLNPMIASRSYMDIEPIELWLDPRALRRGLVYPVDPDTDATALLIQDSGMVPVSTQIAIVNPETCRLCRIGEYGEIWAQSEACAKSFYGSKQEFDLERFNGRTVDGDPSIQYIRTGDLGFLHNVTRPIGAGGQSVEMQILFVLGGIGETFEVNGLNHFPVDIEHSVEKCHRNISPGGCAVFQAGGLVVVLVEVFRKAYLASIVPVIVDAILNEHQLVVDIIAFVSHGDFPRSRLNEKQRGKILASWVTRKLRTIAQFGIRDPESADSQITEVPEPRVGSSINNKPGVNTRGSIQESTLNVQPSSAADAGSTVVGSEDQYHEQPEYAPFEAQYVLSPEDGMADVAALSHNGPAPKVTLNNEPNFSSSAVPETQHTESSINDLATEYEDVMDHRNPYRPPPITTHSPPLAADSGPPRLSITNPSDLSPVSPIGTDEQTPTSAAAGQTPESLRRADTDLTNELSQTTTYSTINTIPDTMSPYSDNGNPFADEIPATAPLQPRVEAQSSMRRSITPPVSQNIQRDTRSVSPPSMPHPPPQTTTATPPPIRPTPPTSRPGSGLGFTPRGRDALPSQQYRYSSYGSGTLPTLGNLSLSPQGPGTSGSRPQEPAADQGSNGAEAAEDADGWPQEALMYSNRTTSPPAPAPGKRTSSLANPPIPQPPSRQTPTETESQRIVRERMGAPRPESLKPAVQRKSSAFSFAGGDEEYDRDPAAETADLTSVAGSVRRRYDGSGW